MGNLHLLFTLTGRVPLTAQRGRRVEDLLLKNILFDKVHTSCPAGQKKTFCIRTNTWMLFNIQSITEHYSSGFVIQTSRYSFMTWPDLIFRYLVSHSVRLVMQWCIRTCSASGPIKLIRLHVSSCLCVKQHTSFFSSACRRALNFNSQTVLTRFEYSTAHSLGCRDQMSPTGPDTQLPIMWLVFIYDLSDIWFHACQATKSTDLTSCAAILSFIEVRANIVVISKA